MPAKITVSVELQQLLAEAQATTEASRQARRREEADRREDRKRLEAKRAKEREGKQRELDDPVGRNPKTAAMGQLKSKEKFSGYFMDVVEETVITRSLRSGVKAVAPTEFYADVADRGYVNGSSSISFAKPSLTYPTLMDCPEYAEVIEEIGEFTTISSNDPGPFSDGWYLIFETNGLTLNRRYYGLIASGLVVKEYDLSSVSLNYVIGPYENVSSFAFTSYFGPGGVRLAPGRFFYGVGYKHEIGYGAGTFGGSIFGRNNPGGPFEIPCTGGWSAASAATGPTVGAWIIAESANVPPIQSVVASSLAGLDLDQAFAGDFSSWQEVGSGGTMTQLLPPSDSGGGGGGE